MTSPAVRILGIDTSLRSTGVGVVERRGQGFHALEYGVIRNAPTVPHSQCLRKLHEELAALIGRQQPQSAAIEGGFFFKNARTAMILGEARGVVIAVCATAGIPVYEYAPRTVKQSLTGWGAAGKDQMARMIRAVLAMDEEPASDAADALALALCHYHAQGVIADLRPEPI